MSGKRERQLRRENRERGEQEAEAQERRKRLGQLGMVAAFLAVIVIVAIIVITGNNEEAGSIEVVEVSQVEKLLDGVPQHGMVLGKPSAKVTLIEFGDLQCPVCKQFSEEMIPKLIEGQVRSGEAKIEFRNFTIISEQSVEAGAAALAAGEQGRAWNFIELFYRNQREERSGYVTDSFLNSIAKGAKVPGLKKWNEQRETERLVEKVESTTEQAEELQFTGTPSFAVKGPNGFETLGSGPLPVGEIEAAIREGG